MAVQVDRDTFIDPVAVTSTAGGGDLRQGVRPPPWQPRPFTTKVEYEMSLALRWMGMPAEQLAQIRPPVPQVLFPPIYGYDETPLTIEEVLDVGRWAPQQRSWTSGAPKPVTQSAQQDYMQDMWSGSARNVSPSLNPMG
jgi:hypothetical protein